MKLVRKTFLEAVALAVLAAAFAFGANELRGAGRIKPTKDYFKADLPPEMLAKIGQSPRHDPAIKANAGDGSSAVQSETPAQVDVASRPPQRASSAPAAAHPAHNFQELSFEGVKEIYDDPDTPLGINLFLDARSKEAFADGHIPGAVVCDWYRIDQHINQVLGHIGQADKVIVYCGGGDCPDSISLCRDLIMEHNVPYEKVYLYAGGFKEWAERDMLVSKGVEE